MTLIAEMQRITRLAAEPRRDGDNIKRQIARAAWRLGISQRRARSFWYAESQAAVRAHEADKLRAALPRLLRERRRVLLAEAAIIKTQLDEHYRAPPDGRGEYQMVREDLRDA